MPASSIRDLIVHDDDLIVATHGRGFWILDDITPLRQLNEQGCLQRRLPLQAADCGARAMEYELRYAAAARRAGIAQSSRWRDPRLLFGSRTRAARSLSRFWTVRASWCGVMPAPIPRIRSIPTLPFLLTGCALRIACRPLRHAPLSVGSAPHATRGCRRTRRRRQLFFGGRGPRYPAYDYLDLGRSRPLHGQTHGQRAELYSAPDPQTGPACQDAGAQPATAVHALAAVVRRDAGGTEGAGRNFAPCVPRSATSRRRARLPKRWPHSTSKLPPSRVAEEAGGAVAVVAAGDAARSRPVRRPSAVPWDR